MAKENNNTALKATPIGMIPKDWTVARIDSILKIKYGKDQKSIATENGKYPILGTGGEMGRTDSFLYDKPSVLIGRKGTIDKPRYMDAPFWTVDTLFYTEIDTKKIFPKWLYYRFTAINWKFYNEASGVPSLSAATISAIQIPIPPIPQQTKIAQLLSTWDESIETLETLIKRKERNKKALMQQLLTGKKRFKEFKSEKWKSILIKDLGKVVSGGTPDTNKEEFFNGKILWCTPTEITKLKGKKYINETERTITELGLKNSSANILPPKSLIVCTRATVGDCAINSVEMSTNQGFKSIIPNEKIEIEFLYYSFLPMKNILLRLANGSTFLEVSKTDFENIALKIPVSIKEQQKIASVISAADEEIQSLKTQLEHCKQQKKGLMQVLLTGKKRIKN